MVTGAQTGEFTLWNGMAFNFETILQAHDHAVCTMKWSHSDQWLVSSDDSGGIKYWQANLNEVQQFAGHAEAVRELSFAPTDQKIVTCSDDSTLKLFDFLTATEEQTLTGHGWDVLTVDWHPRSSLIASGSKDNLVKLWEPRSGANVATLSTHKHSISKVSWNRNGNWLLTGSRDCLLKVYDIRTMKEMQSFTGHTKQITALSWHPTAEGVFASGSYKGELFFWDVNSSSPMGQIHQAHDQAIHWLGFHPVGHVLGTTSEDHATKFWVRNRPGDKLDDKHHQYGRMSDSLPLAEQERNRDHMQAQARSQQYVRRGEESGRGSYNRQEAEGATNARVAVEQARVSAMYAAPQGGGAGRPSSTVAPGAYGGRPPMAGMPPQHGGYGQRPPMQQQQQGGPPPQQYGRPQYGQQPPHQQQQQQQQQQYGRPQYQRR